MMAPGEWVTPSGCAQHECVAVRVADERVTVRRARDGRAWFSPWFTLEEWRVFTEAVKRGEFDV
jgi:hypothetical protein